jgi:acyl-CoA dehydrogenase
VEAVYAKVYAAARQQHLIGKTPDELVACAQERGVITREEADAVARSKALRRAVIMVDDFPVDFGKESLAQHPVDAGFFEARRTA